MTVSNCQESEHNKRTCPTKVDKQTGSSSAAQNSNINNVDEEEMRMAYHEEVVLEMQLPEDVPPLTQPSQTIANDVHNPTTEQVMEDYVTCDSDDTRLAVTVKKLKSKVVKKSEVVEEMSRAKIKKEQAVKIDAMKAQAQVNISKMHNSYIGAMRLGPHPHL